MCRNISNFEIEDLFFKLKLYEKIIIKCKSQYREFEYEEQDERGIFSRDIGTWEHSKEYTKLIDFMQFEGKIVKICLDCGKEMPFGTNKIVLEKELINKTLYGDDIDSIVENQCEDPNYFSYIDHIMNEKVEKVYKMHSIFCKTSLCSNNSKHRQYHIYRLSIINDNGINDLILQKIGQSPSELEFENFKLKNYIEVTENINIEELARAVALHNQGDSVAALIYLRRMLERIVNEKYEKFKIENPTISKCTRFGDKLKCIKNDFPSALSDNNDIYGLLSGGIHSFPKEKCNEFFETIFDSVIILLEQLMCQKTIKDNNDKAHITNKQIHDIRSEIQNQRK